MSAALQIGGVTLGERPRVVAAGGDAEVDALAGAHAADIVELRGDLFDDPSVPRVTAALERLAAAGRPVLFTARAATEGGRAMPEDRRGALYDAALPLVHALDVEIASHALATRLAPRAHARGCRLVLSAHDFSRTPPVDELDALVERGRTLGADLVKLATTTETLADVQTLLAVTLVRRTTGLVTLGMGPYGPLTRVVLPAAGSLLTYGSVGRPTAPGQLSVAEIRRLFDSLLPA
jgi:3-dehydroquinate dehydratase-1